MLGATPLEVKRVYADELEFGGEMWAARMGSKLIDMGLSGNDNAVRFFLQARARWSVPSKMEIDARVRNETDESKQALIQSILAMVPSKEPQPAPPSPHSR